jgi:hypothetical protein
MNRRFKRVYRHYSECEEYAGDMWKVLPIEDRIGMPEKSAALMIDHELFRDQCLDVLESWPNSCDVNLSATVINHQAWIGHAACYLHHGASEDLTRLGWRMMTEEQQGQANLAADVAINKWGDKYELANHKLVKRK